MTNVRGFATLNFYAADLTAAKAWYTEFFGFPPYFEREGGYLEWRVGDSEDEFGIINAAYAPFDHAEQKGGAAMLWHTDDVQATLDRVLKMGATLREGITDRGHGFVTATVVDPFGNVLGLMYNPHYVEITNRSR
jgi:predicted enzyme related to lactoylglutathione lyase